ncbi:hypothetical protein [Streptomyces sp. 8L]|uniref:hypothetical protein n=1 Tax=Streptomyces sp. 8L TaxID=2877242 RepID=UPI001CD1A633|nr:hypothetical protein [Streptomyces sp. 8L]MCA1218858.1 hypothetical protein [Streptomyces sp. 8L]
MIPAAALATLRAGVEVARGNGVTAAEDVAELVADELMFQGWTIVREDATNPAPAGT